MCFEMYSPTRILFGSGKMNELHLQTMPGKKALIVISQDNIAVSFGWLKRLTDQFDSAGVEYIVFNGVQDNPVVQNVNDGAKTARKSGCDFIVALGGGSVIDCSKAISLMVNNEGDYWDYVEETRIIENPRLPVITITTTAGTGTEIAPFFVITNEEQNAKVGFPRPMRYNTWPILAIIDPQIMLTVPSDYTAYQGMDAFAHCAESYISNKANVMSDMYGLAAITTVTDYLPAAVKDGSNLKAREKLAFASLLSGIVMSVGSSVSKHSLEHAMSAYHNNLPHGAGLLLIDRAYYKTLIEKHVCDERFIKMAIAMGNNKAKSPEDFLVELEKLMENCGVADLKMSDYDITPEEFPKFINNARTTSIGYLFTRDRVALTDEECIAIYAQSYK